ncbi:hypothetical protein VTN77DRAFT_8115 [Rasamsonia byssochlamydoides]|uniref:uncharacterized protein n=1 Tax=Rasamsonia byssochlamydoides TaxID=89139 RepID=UPI00374300CF
MPEDSMCLRVLLDRWHPLLTTAEDRERPAEDRRKWEEKEKKRRQKEQQRRKEEMDNWDQKETAMGGRAGAFR